MSATLEKLEKSMVKVTIEVSPEEFEKGLNFAFNKNKGKISVPGFRKGKVPRQFIEKAYGTEIFYEDAANHLIPEAYDNAVKELALDVVAMPEIDVVQINKGEAFIFTALVAVKPEVELGEYKGITIEKQEIEVDEEEITKELDKVREQNSRLVTVDDRAIADGDHVVINYEGFVNDVPFEGGKAENHTLVIGSHSFIDTFEEQLIGKTTGEEVEVNVTFPEEYHSKELEGKPALFKVKINEIKYKELPEVDDEFAKDVSEFDTLDEYKEDIKAKLKEQKENEGKNKKQDLVVDKVIENAKMEIAEPMIEEQANRLAEDFEQRIKYQGLSIEQYFQFTGTDADKFKEQLKPEALKRIQSRLVLEAVAQKEALEVSDEEIDAEIVKMAEMYKMEVEKLKEAINDHERTHMKVDLLVQKALDLLVSEAVEA